MPYDPTLPADHSPLSSAEMRSQLTGLQSNITTATADKVTQAELGAAISAAITGTARNPGNMAPPSFSFSNPPTDSELYALQSWLADLFNNLYRAP